MNRSIKLSEVQTFIRDGLKCKLQNDFTRIPFRIFRERDLHACCYFHLRKFLDGDHTWDIINEPWLKNLKGRGKSAHPDMVLYQNNKSKLLLEFKFLRRNGGIRKKDQRVMKKAIKKGVAKKAYYIETVVDGAKRTRRGVLPYRNHVVTIEMPGTLKGKYLKMYHSVRKPKIRRKSKKR